VIVTQLKNISDPRIGAAAILGVVTLQSGLTVGEAKRLLSGPATRCEILPVGNGEGDCIGAVDALDLLTAPETALVADLVRTDWPAVQVDSDRETAAQLAAATGVMALLALEGPKAVGIVPARALLRILAEEHAEDINRFVGMMKETEGARAALEAPVVSRVARRLPWLGLGLGLSAVTAGIMSYFEDVLTANMTVAIFIPALVYIADAIGTQTEAVAVRGLSLGRPLLLSSFASEAVTGAVIGALLGIGAFLGVAWVYEDLRLAAGVGLSILAAGAAASIIGLALPWLLSLFGMDPAFGSGPVATVIQDAITIVVYFVIIAAAVGA
jgi:magnesium transporter